MCGSHKWYTEVLEAAVLLPIFLDSRFQFSLQARMSSTCWNIIFRSWQWCIFLFKDIVLKLTAASLSSISVLFLLNFIHKCKFSVCRSFPYMKLSSDITEIIYINRHVRVTVYNPWKNTILKISVSQIFITIVISLNLSAT